MKPLIHAALVALVMLATGSATAGPTVYIPPGSGNRVIAVDAASDTITASYSGVENFHSLTPALYHLNTIPGTGKVYASSRSAAKIWVVDQNILQVPGEIGLPAGEGHQIAIVR